MNLLTRRLFWLLVNHFVLLTGWREKSQPSMARQSLASLSVLLESQTHFTRQRLAGDYGFAASIGRDGRVGGAVMSC